MAGERLRVAVCDDDEAALGIISSSLRDVFGAHGVDATTSLFSSAVDLAAVMPIRRFDLLLLDIDMPGISGIEAAKQIHAFDPGIEILILSAIDRREIIQQALSAGASGYLTKSSAPDEMIQAIRAVSSGQRYISPEIAQQMALSQFKSHDVENPFKTLSERELQIMLMITRGSKVNDIAEQLSLSPKTVNSYRYRLFDKLNISGDVELTRMAIRYGMLDAQSL